MDFFLLIPPGPIALCLVMYAPCNSTGQLISLKHGHLCISTFAQSQSLNGAAAAVAIDFHRESDPPPKKNI